MCACSGSIEQYFKVFRLDVQAASGTDLNGGKHGGIERARSVSDRHNDVSGKR